MGFIVMIARGIDVISLEERSRLISQIGLKAADAAIAALSGLPVVLDALYRVAWLPEATPRDRAIFMVVMTYGFQTEDLVPALGENLLRGLLDDAYLAYAGAASAQASKQALPNLEEGLTALRQALQNDVILKLDRQLVHALDEIETATAQMI